MNKYLTKQYIKECDCKEIQRLKYPLMEYDVVYEKPCGGIYRVRFHIVEKGHNNFNQVGLTVSPTYSDRNNYIWLPTGDQLDGEIKKRTCYHYDIEYRSKEYGNMFCCVFIYAKTAMVTMYEQAHKNPLIAKIKLLKELINENTNKT